MGNGKHIGDNLMSVRGLALRVVRREGKNGRENGTDPQVILFQHPGWDLLFRFKCLFPTP